MTFILYSISAFCVISGLIFFFGSAVGVVRFPDFYTRMQAAGKGDTLSTILRWTAMATTTFPAS